MNNNDSVLVGIDYSLNSKNALHEAARIANWADTALCCLHVIDAETIQAFDENDGFDKAGVIEVAQAELESFVADTVGTGHDIDCRVEVGHPFKELVNVINTRSIGLLVLGSHGLHKSDPSRTGTFASRCVRKAPVDVLLVRERQTEPFANIVACVDFSENSVRAARRAAEIAVQDKAALELLHIYRSPIAAASGVGGLGPTLPPSDNRAIISGLRRKLATLAEEISDQNGGIELRTKVIQDAHIASAVVSRLLEVSADLAALGTRGRTGLKGLFIGSTAERLIHDSPCSTLAVKPEGFEYSV